VADLADRAIHASTSVWTPARSRTGNNTPPPAANGNSPRCRRRPRRTTPAWSSGDWGNTGIASVSFDTWNMIRKYGNDTWQTTPPT
jgi:hypothetical protein